MIPLVILLILNALLTLLILWRSFQKDSPQFKGHFESLEKNQERIERLLREEMAQSRQESAASLQRSREEMAQSLNGFSHALLNQLTSLTQMNEQKLENMRQVVEERLSSLQTENSEKLEKMRETVDEKLHSTLEKRLGESFQLVSERLEKVHQGLGEMQSLASGVGDLKKVLANVKTRGMWGEVQLGNLLEQILTPEQYEKNVITKKGSTEPVEFAVKLPGHDGHTVYLPIDAKFPTQDYERLQEAQEQSSPGLVEEASKAIENRLKLEARNIRDKYIAPPQTTDFGILFLPTEGLYAEVLRRAGFCDVLRRDYRVIVAGPTTIAALLNSLQMGFQTLAVQKRASEVWNLLGAVKTEFNKFGDILDKTHKKLQEASSTIEDAARRSRMIERKLKDVQHLPSTNKVQDGETHLFKDTLSDVVIE